ncbi:MAG TPA: trypsin-like peptidase domain-containing protein [Acetobacteraceae bacterium]|nr:trypsin-like peptidase domain-containing protein [Acetobacteraceae bacterium]
MLVLALVAPRGVPPASAAAPIMGWSAIARKVVPAVVNISVLTIAKDGTKAGLGERQEEVGSGFIIDPSGIIVTNKHVVAGAFRITVTLDDGRELPAKLIAAAAIVDLAVLKVDAGHPLPVLKLAPNGAVQPGDPVLAVGNPLGVGMSLSAGIVSGVNRDLMKTPFDDYVQTDAAINHGNSGGPLIDTKGQVVGVDTILLTNIANEGSNGLGFAISANVVGYVVRHLIDPNATPVGWIGTSLQDVSPDLADAFGMDHPRGFLITGIDKNSPARQAGLHAGDVILRCGTSPDQPKNARALMRKVAMLPIGKPEQLEIWRRGKTFPVTVTVRAWPDLMESRGTIVATPDTELPLPAPDLGLLLARITPVARQQYKLGDAKGVLVVAVDTQSEAYGHGLEPGDLIEKVQGETVSSPADVYRLVHAMAGRDQFIALLVRWPHGLRWVALRAGGEAEPDSAALEARAAHGSSGTADAPVSRGSPPP